MGEMRTPIYRPSTQPDSTQPASTEPQPGPSSAPDGKKRGCGCGKHMFRIPRIKRLKGRRKGVKGVKGKRTPKHLQETTYQNLDETLTTQVGDDNRPGPTADSPVSSVPSSPTQQMPPRNDHTGPITDSKDHHVPGNPFIDNNLQTPPRQRRVEPQAESIELIDFTTTPEPVKAWQPTDPSTSHYITLTPTTAHVKIQPTRPVTVQEPVYQHPVPQQAGPQNPAYQADQTDQPPADQTDQPPADQADPAAQAEQPLADQTEQPPADQADQPPPDQADQPPPDQADQTDQPPPDQAAQIPQDKPKVVKPKVDKPKVHKPKVDKTKVDKTKVDKTKVDKTKVTQTKVDQHTPADQSTAQRVNRQSPGPAGPRHRTASQKDSHDCKPPWKPSGGGRGSANAKQGVLPQNKAVTRATTKARLAMDATDRLGEKKTPPPLPLRNKSIDFMAVFPDGLHMEPITKQSEASQADVSGSMSSPTNQPQAAGSPPPTSSTPKPSPSTLPLLFEIDNDSDK